MLDLVYRVLEFGLKAEDFRNYSKTNINGCFGGNYARIIRLTAVKSSRNLKERLESRQGSVQSEFNQFVSHHFLSYLLPFLPHPVPEVSASMSAVEVKARTQS